MEKRNALFSKGLTFILTDCLLWSLTACQPKSAVESTAIAPVFFPEPPDQPRLQFLTSYSGAVDFGGPKTDFLETFVLGAPEESQDRILKPYGVAIHKGKIYVCDVGQSQVKVIDLKKKTFETFPSGRPLQSPVNILIEPDGTKYVSDSLGGAIFVYNAQDKLVSFLGKDLGIKPIDLAVRGEYLYVTDDNSKQVLVLDKTSGELIRRIGKPVADKANWGPDEFDMITGVALDQQGNVYVGDKLKNKVTKFDASGVYSSSYGKYGSSPDSLIFAKGIAIDKENRVWVVDTGPATAVKVYNNEGVFLMYFGTLGKRPGQMYLPATVRIDYDNVDLFKQYAVPGAKLEFLVLVTNQLGPHKVGVYGFGTFPDVAKLQRAQADLPENTD